MTNKLVVIINSLKVQKIKKILLYIPNYSCLQNPWLGSYRPQIPFLSVLNWICWPPPKKIPGYATALYCWASRYWRWRHTVFFEEWGVSGPTTQRQTSDDRNLHQQRHENLKRRKFLFTLRLRQCRLPRVFSKDLFAMVSPPCRSKRKADWKSFDRSGG